MKSQADITKAHCNFCVGKRNHLFIHKHERKWEEQISDDPPDWIYGKDLYELLQCAGCERITLRHTAWFCGDCDDEGSPIPRVSYYPPPIFRRQPKWLLGMEGLHFIVSPISFVPRLFKEVYTALHDDCPSLAAMGIRALLERVMITQVADQGTFAKNLLAFQEQGFISVRQQEVLEATLEVGHASIHRAYDPTPDDLRMTLDITENILESVYVSGDQAKKLKQRVPPKNQKR